MASRARSALLLPTLALIAAGALSGCGGADAAGEAPPASRGVSAGPLSGIVGQLETEDDSAEHAERAESEESGESAQERQESKEEIQQQEAQHRETEERAIEEEAHVGANGPTSS
jgi:hypothetical protein